MITIVDYGLGNLRSVENMLRKCGAAATISSDPAEIAAAEKLILPGVGAFDAGMSNLNARGLVAPLNHAVLERQVPILGVCLGMQLMTRGSEEGTIPGLGWIAADTVRFRPATEGRPLHVPHMGWSEARFAKESPLTEGFTEPGRFYFVHSYHVVCDDAGDVLAWTSYGYDFASGISRGNVSGVQFHPEKSHRFGMQLLNNYAQD